MRKAIIHLKKTDAILRRIIETAGPYRIEYLVVAGATDPDSISAVCPASFASVADRTMLLSALALATSRVLARSAA